MDTGEIIEEIGFDAYLWNGNLAEPAEASVACGGFSPFLTNVAMIRCEAQRLYHFAPVAEMSRILVRVWRPDWLIVMPTQLWDNFPVAWRAGPRAGWLTYLADNICDRVQAMEVGQERFCDTGTLLIATRQDFSVDNPEYVEATRQINAWLADRRQRQVPPIDPAWPWSRVVMVPPE